MKLSLNPLLNFVAVDIVGEKLWINTGCHSFDFEFNWYYTVLMRRRLRIVNTGIICEALYENLKLGNCAVDMAVKFLGFYLIFCCEKCWLWLMTICQHLMNFNGMCWSRGFADCLSKFRKCLACEWISEYASRIWFGDKMFMTNDAYSLKKNTSRRDKQCFFDEKLRWNMAWAHVLRHIIIVDTHFVWCWHIRRQAINNWAIISFTPQKC